MTEAQRLRYRVFSQEMGARLSPPPGSPPGLDIDRFDPFCEHLLVRAVERGTRGPVVGTYRVLSPSQARKAGGYYSDAEFDLAPLAGLRARAVELGRSCVHADWRLGGVIMGMWSALGEYMLRHGLDTMIGCASIGLADGLLPALALWEGLRHTHLAAPQWRVTPHCVLPGASLDEPLATPAAPRAMPDAPPLIKGYLRCGARVLGPPALDAQFNTADLPMMLRLQDMAPRYRKHFLEAA
ncbi:GNAT family N-acetyltransferase [Caenimonas sp. DR4.4]|uniref:L-ornithine N(alpha)-acyltransferase n=1 Tax=Caenimonas aquaedulcis TaxID=2793270 RepID=A0A931MH61_9BURK|nr:GNAT family N-acetyltransferase [Caenimonas aquaedulcis]